MEKEGLVRGMQFLKEQTFSNVTLVTDRHTQIAKWMREKSFNTDHRYDIWHLAKGMCSVAQFISNHLGNHNTIARMYACLLKFLELTSGLVVGFPRNSLPLLSDGCPCGLFPVAYGSLFNDDRVLHAAF